MNCFQFRQNMSTTAQGQINEKWSGPTRMFIVNLRRILDKETYTTEDIQDLANKLRFMLDSRTPDRALLEVLQKDIEAHLDFLLDIDEILL